MYTYVPLRPSVNQFVDESTSSKTSPPPTNSTGSRVRVPSCAELLERAWHPASSSTCLRTVQSPSSPPNSINPELLQLPPLNDSHNPTRSTTSYSHTASQHTPSTSMSPPSNLELATATTPMTGPTSMVMPTYPGRSPNGVAIDVMNEGRSSPRNLPLSNIPILAPLPQFASTARLDLTTPLGSSFNTQWSLQATSSRVTLDHMQLFDYTVAESQPQWSAASNSTIESRQALGGGSTAMPPRSKRARSVLGESESRGEQSRYEKNPQASVERAESGEQSRHEESLQTSQRRRRKTSQRSAPKTQRSARKQQKFDSLPALETPGIPWLMIPNKLSQIPEYTYFDPRISQPPIPYGSRLSLYSQNPDPSTRIHQPFRCRYIDPWAHNLCDQVLTTINSWEQHFNTHACKERKRIDADPSQYKQENAIALQDPRFNGTVPWTCDICGATARKSSRSDSLKRHKKTKHPDVEPPVEPPAKQPPLKRRRLE